MAATEIQILRAIARGHPTRIVAVTQGRVSTLISGLTWEEIQVAIHATFEDISDHIARLLQKKLIDSGREYPSFFAMIRGQQTKTYFWITTSGREALQSLNLAPPSSNDNLDLVAIDLEELGYELTPYGADVALKKLNSGYSDAETASHIALATLARDVREAGSDLQQVLSIASHAHAMFKMLTQFKENGLMREEVFSEHGQTLAKIAIPSPEQKEWVDCALSNETVGEERLAVKTTGYYLSKEANS